MVGDVVRARHLGDGLHHRHRADGVDGVDAARVEDVLEGLGHEAVAPVGAVVGAGDDVAQRAQLVLQDDPLLRAAADDAGDVHAALGQGLDDRQQHGRADAAADAHGVPGREEVGLGAQRTGDVLDGLADLELGELGRARADGLDHQGDRAGLGVVVRDRERDALRARTLPDDDELAGTPDLRDPGSLDDEADDVRRELLALDDGMHATSLVLVSGSIVARTAPAALPAHGPVLQSEGHAPRGPSGDAPALACRRDVRRGVHASACRAADRRSRHDCAAMEEAERLDGARRAPAPSRPDVPRGAVLAADRGPGDARGPVGRPGLPRRPGDPSGDVRRPRRRARPGRRARARAAARHDRRGAPPRPAAGPAPVRRDDRRRPPRTSTTSAWWT